MLEKVKNKKITNRRKIIFTIVLILVFVFGFGKGEKAEAATWYCTCFGGPTNLLALADPCNDREENCQTTCTQTCQNQSYTSGEISENIGNIGVNSEIKESFGNKNDTLKSASTSCSFDQWASGAFINCLLLTILNLMIMLMIASTTLFGWIMEPESIVSILSSNAIYTAWATVRDVLNVSFIMFLLFSAFATVFQVEKYSYKKILLTLVIMALLVNFSFPISRFIIDVSNMMMFYFANALGINGVEKMIDFADAANLPGLIAPKIASANTTYLFAAVIFLFIFAITIATISILFLIRTIALAILIVFSSLAFVGTAIPPMASYASDWWKKLFNYAFFGPIMLFMIYIASTLMTEVGKSGRGVIKTIATGQTKIPDLITDMSFFAIPIVILWMGLGVAQSMSIAGASIVVGKAQGFMKGVGSWTARAPFRGLAWGARQTGIPGGVRQKWQNWQKSGRLFGSDRREAREATIAGRGPFAVPNVIDQANAKRIKEARENHDMENMTPDMLLNITQTGNNFERAAALSELTAKNALDMTNPAHQAAYNRMMAEFGNTSQVFNNINNKLKTYDPAAAFAHIANVAERQARIDAHLNSNQFDSKKLVANSLGNTEFIQRAFEQRALNAKDLIGLRKKGDVYNNAINRSTDAMVRSGIYTNNTNEVHRNVQMAHFAQTGDIYDATFANNIFGNMDEETANRMTTHTIMTHQPAIENNIKQGRIKNIVHGMRDNVAAKRLVRNLSTSGPHQSFVSSHPDLANYV